MGAGTTEITETNFQATLDSHDIVILDWWAPWCGPCLQFAPIYERVAQSHPDIVFGKVNTEEQPDLAAAFEISSIPTVMVFREKVLLFSQPGMLPPHVLEDLLRQVREVDMEEVRKKLEEEGDDPHDHEGCDHDHDHDHGHPHHHGHDHDHGHDHHANDHHAHDHHGHDHHGHDHAAHDHGKRPESGSAKK